MREKARIMVFGTFDLLHPGHLSFFKQAKALARKSYLIVSVARSSNVKRIKGRRPKTSQLRRIDNLKKLEIIDKVILGELSDYLSAICKQRPDIIALGYDQMSYTKKLRQKLKKKGCTVKVVRLKAFKPYKYKTSLINALKKIN